MKLYHLLLTTELTTAQTETRCFPSYADSLPATTLRYHVHTAYSTSFNGLFQPGQAISACVNVGANSINLQVRNGARDGARRLRATEYSSGFETIITQCQDAEAESAGGCIIASEWSFRIDPNS